MSLKRLYPPALRRELAQARDELARLREQAARQEAEMAAAREACEQARVAVQRTEERFALAVRSANDGLWEWDPASGVMVLSPRWKAMLGYTDEALPNRREAWASLVHPDDLPRVEAAIRHHLDDAQTTFDCEMRVRHKDGRYRWMLSRGAALRHASGTPYRMVGLDTDVTRIKRVEDIVAQIAEGTASTQGETFFRAMVQHFAGALEVTCAFITECVDRPTTRVRTLAYWKAQDFRDNIEFELAGTPCEAVVQRGTMSFIPCGVGQAFPRDAAYESYIGVPIFSSAGEVIGHLAFFDTRTMAQDVLVEPIFRIFCARAGAELERRSALEQLARHESVGANG